MFFREMLLRSFFQPDLAAPADTLYAAVTLAVAKINQSGLTILEPTVPAYARVGIPLDSADWQLDGFGGVYNVNEVVFADPDPGDDWGYLAGWALLDAPDTGMVLASGPLVTPTPFTSDMPGVSIPPQGITVALHD
jgi:hypothetical protein